METEQADDYGSNNCDTKMTAMRSRKRMMKPESGLGRALVALGMLALGLSMSMPLAAQRPERPALNITGYVIDAEIDTSTHHLAAKAVVTFTAPENTEEVSFGFHPALKVTNISDESGKVLTGERWPTAPFA